MIKAINTALTSLNVNAKKVENSASNIANMGSVGSLDADHEQQPYSPKIINQNSNKTGGVTFNVSDKDPAFVPSYSPNSPFADKEGFIGVPNVNLIEEAMNIKMAELNYKASAKIIQTASEMQNELTEALDKKV